MSCCDCSPLSERRLSVLCMLFSLWCPVGSVCKEQAKRATSQHCCNAEVMCSRNVISRPSLHDYSHLQSVDRRAGVTVTVEICIQEDLCSKLRRYILTNVYPGFPQYLLAKTGLIPRLDHDCFLQNPFQFTIHESSYHPMLQSFDTHSVVK